VRALDALDARVGDERCVFAGFGLLLSLSGQQPRRGPFNSAAAVRMLERLSRAADRLSSTVERVF
jgi:hypothetical protein